MKENRRKFLRTAGIAAAILPTLKSVNAFASITKKIRVVVWDERQPEQSEAYENFLGNAIAKYLKKQPGFSVISVALDDAQQGLSDDILNNCDVLVWWSHQRQAEVSIEKSKQIVKLIADGKLSLISLHSAHWSTPFVEAMNEITKRRAELHKNATKEIVYIAPKERYEAPKYDTRITPYTEIKKFPDGSEKHFVHLPICCFPKYSDDGKPSTVNILKPNHPITKGIPAQFEITHTEMYDEVFHVPEPDEVVLEERWASGAWFRSGMVWNLRKGKVFYFRPGHQTFSVYKQQYPLQIVANAARWLGTK